MQLVSMTDRRSGAGFGPNYPLTNTAVTGLMGNAAQGYFSDQGPFPDWRNISQ